MPRHSGLALGLNSTKHTSIDVDVRKLTDYLILKNLELYGLPRDLWWTCSVFNSNTLQNFKPNEFALITKEGNTGRGLSIYQSGTRGRRKHLRKVGANPKCYEPEKESEQAVGIVREALKNLEEPTPTEVSEWIKENKGVEIAPKGVGLYAKRVGYSSELTSENGKRRRVLKPVSK